MKKEDPFGSAIRRARLAVGLTQAMVAHHVGKVPLSVRRWETGTVPSYEDRVKLLEVLGKAPRPLLEDLARVARVPLAPLPALPTLAPAGPPEPPPASAMDVNAQQIVDDAVREAAEDLDLIPRLVRPVVSRLLERMARARVPMDVGARMVLGVPKRPDKGREQPKEEPAAG